MNEQTKVSDDEPVFAVLDNPAEFREDLITWVISYCKNEGRKWGHVKFSKALIKNSHPERVEDKNFIEDKASPFYETLRSLLYRKGKAKSSVITLSNNRHLYDLIFLYIYHQDLPFLYKVVYCNRLEKIAQSILDISGRKSDQKWEAKNFSLEKKDKNKGTVVGSVAYQDTRIKDRYYAIADWGEGYLHVFLVDYYDDDEGAKYIINPGVLICQGLRHLGFIYFELAKRVFPYEFYLSTHSSSHIIPLVTGRMPLEVAGNWELCEIDSRNNEEIESLVDRVALI